MVVHSFARNLHEQSQMSYPSKLKQMQISNSPSPREVAHLLSALESSAERIHEERGGGAFRLQAPQLDQHSGKRRCSRCAIEILLSLTPRPPLPKIRRELDEVATF